MQTLLLDTKRGRFRLCKECFAYYEQSKLQEGYEEAKNNILLYGITGTDAYELIKQREKFIKSIKEEDGRTQNRNKRLVY